MQWVVHVQITFSPLLGKRRGQGLMQQCNHFTAPSQAQMNHLFQKWMYWITLKSHLHAKLYVGWAFSIYIVLLTTCKNFFNASFTVWFMFSLHFDKKSQPRALSGIRAGFRRLALFILSSASTQDGRDIHFSARKYFSSFCSLSSEHSCKSLNFAMKHEKRSEQCLSI